MARDPADTVLDLLVQMKEVSMQYSTLEESNRENMNRIDRMCHVLFERIRRTPDEDEAAKQRRQERIAKLEEAIASKDKEIASLIEERDDYRIELTQLNNALKLLVVDHKNLEDEKELKETLLSEIQQLKDVITQKENVISQMQKENDRIRSEKAMILEEVAKAVQNDEQSIAAEDSQSCE
ncbi:hypothetical protein WA577_002665, partial [Blastocystis sp. JDR]